MDLAPELIERWRHWIDLSRDPDARPEDIAEGRERLANLIGPVKLFPVNGRLVAEAGLQIVVWNPLGLYEW